MFFKMADNKTVESRNVWIKALDNMKALNPQRVIAGHYVGESKVDTSIIDFNQNYLRAFENANGKSSNAQELIDTMKSAYRNICSKNSLWSSVPRL